MSKEKFSERRNINFFYLDINHVEDYKLSVKNYLSNISEEVEHIGEPYVTVDFYDFRPKIRRKPTGHLFIYDIEDNYNKLEEICKYVLSKERKFIPVEVDCSNKKDYPIIEKILKENYGEKGRLTNGFLGLSALFGMRRIKRV
jgi:hypothetical protein